MRDHTVCPGMSTLLLRLLRIEKQTKQPSLSIPIFVSSSSSLTPPLSRGHYQEGKKKKCTAAPTPYGYLGPLSKASHRFIKQPNLVHPRAREISLVNQNRLKPIHILRGGYTATTTTTTTGYYRLYLCSHEYNIAFP